MDFTDTSSSSGYDTEPDDLNIVGQIYEDVLQNVLDYIHASGANGVRLFVNGEPDQLNNSFYFFANVNSDGIIDSTTHGFMNLQSCLNYARHCVQYNHVYTNVFIYHVEDEYIVMLRYMRCI